jgi:hypothetical protein
MLCECEVVPMYEVKEMLLFYAFKLWVIIEEVVVGSIDFVDILIEEVLCCCHFEEELWVVGWWHCDCCDLLG